MEYPGYRLVCRITMKRGPAAQEGSAEGPGAGNKRLAGRLMHYRPALAGKGVWK